MIKKLWGNLGMVVGIYSVYKQLTTLNQAKDEIYFSLSPEQRAEWNRILGPPAAAQIKNPVPVYSAPIPVTSVIASPETNLKAQT